MIVKRNHTFKQWWKIKWICLTGNKIDNCISLSFSFCVKIQSKLQSFCLHKRNMNIMPKNPKILPDLRFEINLFMLSFYWLSDSVPLSPSPPHPPTNQQSFVENFQFIVNYFCMYILKCYTWIYNKSSFISKISKESWGISKDQQ